MSYRNDLVDKLKLMVGENYKYYTKYYLIDKYEVTENFVKVYANDSEQLVFPYNSALQTLNDKFILAESDAEIREGETAIVVQNMSQSTNDIQSILLDSIKRIQADKEYIPQAKAITNIAPIKLMLCFKNLFKWAEMLINKKFNRIACKGKNWLPGE